MLLAIMLLRASRHLSLLVFLAQGLGILCFLVFLQNFARKL